MKDTVVHLACPKIRFISVHKIYSYKKITMDTNMLECSSTYTVDSITSYCARKGHTT